MTRFLDQVESIKKGFAGDRDGKDGLMSENEFGIVIETVHEMSKVAVEAYRGEVIDQLGCTTADLDHKNVEKLWRDLLSDAVWQRLEEKTRDYLTIAGLLYSSLTRHTRQNKDWAAVSIALIKSIELELNRKLGVRFWLWLEAKGRGRFELSRLVPGLSDSAGVDHQLLDQAKDPGPDATGLSMPLGWLYRGASDTDSNHLGRQRTYPESTAQVIQQMFAEFINDFEQQSIKELVKELPRTLDLFHMMKLNCVQTQFLRREKVTELVHLTTGILFALTRLPELPGTINVDRKIVS